MAYLALYRKWRPTTLNDLKGQAHVKKTLMMAIKEGKIGHAYLFAGPRGTGKTSTAKILAKALNCLNPKDGEPCGECESCKKIDSNSSMDVFEIDAASNRGIDEIRDLRETVKFAPVDGKYKVYIIDEVHMLTMEAFNALLKTLEEPPKFVIFILATTEAHKVPATIQSRCQRYDFRRISVSEIEDRLRFVAGEMKFNVEEDAYLLIATYADGGLRDALSLLDQCAAMSDGNIKKETVLDILGLVGNAWISELAEAIGESNTEKVLTMIDDIVKNGKELRQIVNELSLCLRTVMIYGAAGTLSGMNLYKIDEANLQKLSKLWNRERVISALKKLNETAYALKWTNAERITVEVSLISLCYGETEEKNNSAQIDLAAERRIDRLETMVRELTAKLASGAPIVKNVVASTETIPEKQETHKIDETKEPQKVELQDEIQKQEKAKPEDEPKKQEERVSASDNNVKSASNEEGAKLWAEMLKRLEQTGNRPAVACLKNGECISLTDSEIVVSFTTKTFATVAAKMHKKVVEETIKAISGKNLILTTESSGKSKKTSKNQTTQIVAPKTEKVDEVKSAPVATKSAIVEPKAEAKQKSKFAPNFEELEETERESLDKAIKIFGDDFVEPINAKTVKLAESIKKTEPNVKPTHKPDAKPSIQAPPPPVTDEYDFLDSMDYNDVPPPDDMDFY